MTTIYRVEVVLWRVDSEVAEGDDCLDCKYEPLVEEELTDDFTTFEEALAYTNEVRKKLGR